MSPIDNVSAHVVIQAPLPAGWRTKRMTAHDLEDIVAVELATFKFPRPCGNSEDSSKSGHLAIVLYDGGNEVAGYLIFMPVVDEMYLLNVIAAPTRQRQGLGHWLPRLAQVPTLAHDFDGLLLEMRPSNVGAVALYHRSGSVEVSRCKHYYLAENSIHEDALIMRMVCETSRAEVT